MKKILIVDDDESQIDVFKKRLLKEGFSVKSIDSGEKALELLILDILMPGMDGLTFYYDLRNKLKKNIPTILLTNLESSAYQEDIKEYIVKADISLDDLVAKVKKYI